MKQNPNSKIIINTVTLNQLLINNVTDFNIINVLSNIDRGLFLENHLKQINNVESHIYFSKDRFILSIRALGYMLQLALLHPFQKVLVVGADLGYTVSVLSSLYVNISCLEKDMELIEKTKANMHNLNIPDIKFYNSSFSNPSGIDDTFDVILFTGAFFELPSKYTSLLKTGGKIIGIENKNNISQVKLLEKNKVEAIKTSYHDYMYLPYLDEELAPKYSFSF